MTRRIWAHYAAFEAYLLALCVLTGSVGCLTAAARSRSIVAAFPQWSQLAWYLGLFLGGCVGLAGLAMRHSEVSLMTERAGLWLLTGLCASFGVATLGYAGASGIPGALMIAGFAGICLIRAIHIQGELRDYRALRQVYISAPPREAR